MESNVLYFQRDIQDFEEHLSTNLKLAKRFFHIENKKIDKSTKDLIYELKHNKIPSKLPESNIFKFQVKWDKDYGVSLKSHPEYIKNFGETFYEQVKKLIDQNQQKEKNILNLYEKELLQEVLDHASFCNFTVDKFHGRADVLDKVNLLFYFSI